MHLKQFNLTTVTEKSDTIVDAGARTDRFLGKIDYLCAYLERGNCKECIAF